MEGTGVYMFRNLYNRDGETKPRDLTGGKATKKETALFVEEKNEKGAEILSSMATAMATGKGAEARRRLSHSARANLPVLVDA